MPAGAETFVLRSTPTSPFGRKVRMAIEVLVPEALRSGHVAHRTAYQREPAVRSMTAAEIAQWPTGGSDDATGTTGPVSAEVAAINDRWALHATARVDDIVRETWMSCREENLESLEPLE